MVYISCCLAAQNRVHTAVVMASQQPAIPVTSRQRTQCRSSIRLLRASRPPALENIRRAPLRRHQRSPRSLQCRPAVVAMCINSRAQSHRRWLPSSMLAISGLSLCQGIIHLRQVGSDDIALTLLVRHHEGYQVCKNNY